MNHYNITQEMEKYYIRIHVMAKSAIAMWINNWNYHKCNNFVISKVIRLICRTGDILED